LLGEFDRRIQRVKVERDNQAASRMGIEGQSYRWGRLPRFGCLRSA
jgi:hypothetical protein